MSFDELQFRETKETMNLNWGGLSDIKGNWRPPHESHNAGKEVDIGLGNFKISEKKYDENLVYLLRYVITQEKNFRDFAKDEGDDISRTLQAKDGGPHIHIYFKR